MALQITQENGQTKYTMNNWQEGIADSPELGFSNMRNVEIGMFIGEVLPAYLPVTKKQTSKQNQTYTTAIATPGVFTSSLVHQLNLGAAITFSNSGGTLPTGLSTTGAYNGATAYVVGDTMEANGQIWYAIKAGTGHTYTDTAYWREAFFYVTSTPTTTTFKVANSFHNFLNATEVAISGAGTGTNKFSTVDMGVPFDKATSRPTTAYGSSLYFIQCTNGITWMSPITASIASTVFTPIQGNSSGAGYGLNIFTGSDGKQWLISCSATNAEFLNLTDYINSSGGAVASWTIASSNFAFQASTVYTKHKNVLSIQDNRVYFCDGTYISYLFEVATKVFNPTDTTTFTFTTLALPTNSTASCIEELSTNLWIGDANFNFIYTWDRQSDHPISAVRVAEDGVFEMLNVNNTLYILAGTKGVIYMTQGYTVDAFKKLPEYITTGSVLWGGIARVNGHLLVGVLGSDPAQSSTYSNAGVYKIFLHTLEKGTLVCDNSALASGTTAYPRVIIPVSADTYYFASAKVDGTSIGADFVTPSNGRYSDGSSYVESQLLSVSPVEETRTLEMVGIELGYTLQGNESIDIYWRETPLESYTLTNTGSNANTFSYSINSGIVNDYIPFSVSDVNALQIKAVVSSATGQIRQSPRLKTVIVK